jgi:hypothetical protein
LIRQCRKPSRFWQAGAGSHRVFGRQVPEAIGITENRRIQAHCPEKEKSGEKKEEETK